MTNTDLRTPTEWESHEGIRIANRTVYRIHGRHEFTPISYETFRNITEGLTVSPIPKIDNLDAGWLANGTLASANLKAGKTSHDRLLLESRLKERIETKIEEYEETITSMIFGDLTSVVAKANARGTIDGLKLALLILEES